MSGRKLPHRMTAVIRSLTAARDTYLITRDPDERILSGEQWSKLDDADPFPDVVQCALHRSLRQPALALFRADREKDPVRTTQRDMNAVRWGQATGISDGHV